MIENRESNNFLLSRAFRELEAVFVHWRVWFLMGNQDILMRYRRSKLGPFWISISMASTVLGIGILYSGIFEAEFGPYISFIGAGFLVWGLIGGGLVDGCNSLIEAEQQIRSVKVATSVLCARTIWRNAILFFHNLIVIVLLLALTGYQLGFEMLLTLPGLMLLSVFLFASANVLAPLTLKYRDIGQIVGSLVQFLFFLTPIIWMPDQGRVASSWINLNPFYHLIEIVRAPILGEYPTVMNWTVSFGCTLTVTLVAVCMWAYSYRRRYLWL